MNGRHIEPGADVELNEDLLIKTIKDDLDYAWRSAKPFLDIMVTLKLEHDNALDDSKMPTRSKMSLPYKYTQVEEALGKAHEYLWPPTNTIEVTPVDEGIDMDTARKVERGLYYMAKDKMSCAEESLAIERDSVKVGVGYGIVEPFTFQRLERNIFSMENQKGKLMNRSVEMGVSEAITSLRLRYVSPGQIVPYPDGWCPNGHGSSSITFFLDFMGEREFRTLVSSLQEEAETLDFNVAKLSPEQAENIVKKAKYGSHNNIPDGWFTHVKKLGGIDYKKLANAEQTAQATIPIVKVYREGEHVWLANGEVIIYRQAAKVQTFRCPILRCCAVRDGMHWFPYTDAEALRDVNYNRNVWLNLVFDIMTWAANRPLVYSANDFDEPPEFGPDARIPVPGPDARTGAAFLQPPGIGADTLQVGEIMDNKADEISGKTDFTQKNYSRGGQHAFNDLLNSSRGRERLAGAVIESGFYKDLFDQILIYMQIAGVGYEGNTRTFDEDRGEEHMEFLAVDADDFKNSFDISVALDKKFSADEFAFTDRLAIYREEKERPDIDLYELRRFLYGRDQLVHRISKSKQVVKEIQGENREDERAAVQAGIQKAQGPAATPELAGAELGGAL